jgi:hypothetical protein
VVLVDSSDFGSIVSVGCIKLRSVAMLPDTEKVELKNYCVPCGSPATAGLSASLLFYDSSEEFMGEFRLR